MIQKCEPAADAVRTVLIVEDQIEMRAIASAYLERQGYRVLATDNGADAVRQARAEKPDLIFMDISIPGMASAPPPNSSATRPPAPSPSSSSPHTRTAPWASGRSTPGVTDG
jgi:hypothetical protein